MHPPGIDVHDEGWGKGPKLVFGPTPVDAGFSAPRSVHCGKWGCGDVNQPHSSLPNGGGKTDCIAECAAACRDHDRGSGDAPIPELRQELVDLLPRFEWFTSCKAAFAGQTPTNGVKRFSVFLQQLLLKVRARESKRRGRVRRAEEFQASWVEKGMDNPWSKVHKKRLRWSSLLTVVPPGFEPGTHGFSIRCSTN